VIKVGAPTEAAQKELKQRVEDAVAATRAAMEEGIVPGGGIALFNIEIEEANEPVKNAANLILMTAIRAPLKAIIENSGENADKISTEIKQKQKERNQWIGFNALKNEVADLKEAGIIDPLKVVKIAFINAVSVAANYLTVGAAITDLPEKEEKKMPGGMPRGMGMGEDY